MWISIERGLPVDGDYMVKVLRDEEIIEIKKRLKGGHWFGGCRPFCESDVVTHYFITPKH